MRRVHFSMLLKWAGAAAAVVLLGLYMGLGRPPPERRAALEVRVRLQQEGFKTELNQFQFSVSPAHNQRMAVLTNAGQACRDLRFRLGSIHKQAVGTNQVVVGWKRDWTRVQSGIVTWGELAAELEPLGAGLDGACEVLQEGPVRFEPIGRLGMGTLLPYLDDAKQLASALAVHTETELHGGDWKGAWRSVLALTRLVTAWDPGPFQIEHLVRFACLHLAWRATWSALQARCWTDDELELLMREWQAAEFLAGLPETVAFERAGFLDACQGAREAPVVWPWLQSIRSDLLRSPWGTVKGLPSSLGMLRKSRRYRRVGTYQDEQATLVHYQKEEAAFRRVIGCETWEQMLSVPGVTNSTALRGAEGSPIISMLQMKSVMLQAQGGGPGGFMKRAAEAEAQRRVILAALALERYRLRHGQYPDALEGTLDALDLKPDFIDGKPLRYQRIAPDDFLLYSIGTDGVDDGGILPPERPIEIPSKRMRPADLVWPRPVRESLHRP